MKEKETGRKSEEGIEEKEFWGRYKTVTVYGEQIW